MDDYFGTKVADRTAGWRMTTPPRPRRWVEAQNAVTFGYLAQIPERERIRRRLTTLWNYERYGLPSKRGAPLRLHAQRRPAEPGRALRRGALDAAPRGAARPQHALGRRHRRAGRHCLQRRRQALAYALADGGLGLDRVEGARRRHRQGPARRDPLVEVLRRRVDEGRQGLLLQPLRRAEGRRGADRASTRTRRSTSTARHAAGARTRSSTSGPTSPTGASAPTSPTTAASCSSTSQRGHRPEEPRLRPGPARTPDGEGRARSSTSSTPPTASSATTARRFYVLHRPGRAAQAPRGDRPARTRRRRRGRRSSRKRAGQRRAGRRRRWSATGSSRRGRPTRTTRLRDLRPRRQARARGGAARASAPSAVSAASARTRRPSTPSPPSPRPTTIYRYDVGDAARARSSGSRRSTFDPAQYETDAGLLPEQGRHEGPDVRDRTRRGSSATAQNPTLPLRLRRLQHLADAGLLARDDRVDGDGRRLRRGQPARRRRVRRGWHEAGAERTSRTSSTTSSPPPSG